MNAAYLRLIDCSRVQWQDRAHFFAISAQVMRRILVDLARAGKKQKRGWGLAVHVSHEEALGAAVDRAPDWVALDDALNALGALDSRKANVVEMRLFGGLDVPEVAAVLQVSVETVHRDWRFAKTWQRRELGRETVGYGGWQIHRRGRRWSGYTMRPWAWTPMGGWRCWLGWTLRCGGEVESLLAHDLDGDDFLDRPAVELAAPTLTGGEMELAAGTMVGACWIVRSVGRGGMGTVCEAEQQFPAGSEWGSSITTNYRDSVYPKVLTPSARVRLSEMRILAPARIYGMRQSSPLGKRR